MSPLHRRAPLDLVLGYYWTMTYTNYVSLGSISTFSVRAVPLRCWLLGAHLILSMHVDQEHTILDILRSDM